MNTAKQTEPEPGYDGEYEEKIAKLEGALDEILKANSLVTAKEIAADTLEVDVDEFLVDDLDEEFNRDMDGSHDNFDPGHEW